MVKFRMMQILLYFLILLGKLPAKTLNFFCKSTGYLYFILKENSSSIKRLKKNLLITSLATENSVRAMSLQSIQSWCVTVSSTLIAWQKNINKINKLFSIDDYQHLDVIRNSLKQQQLLIMSPHICCFELLLKYVSYEIPEMRTVAIYKSTKNMLFDNVMTKGRIDKGITPVSTNNISKIVRLIRNGYSVSMLPDHVAASKNGVWVKFFGHDVFTNSLAAQLYQRYKLIPIMVFSQEKHSKFSYQCIKLCFDNMSKQEIMQSIYNSIEIYVKDHPTQYYWLYDIFRRPHYAIPK